MPFNYKHYLWLVLVLASTVSAAMLYANSTGTDSIGSTDLRSQIDTPDRDQARAAIRQLGQSGVKENIEYISELWEHGAALQNFRHPGIIDDPVVRLMMAQQLLHNEATDDGSYGSYIKSQAQSRDWVIRSSAADALVAVGDKESITLLHAIALTPHRLVALRAVRALDQLSTTGPNSDRASIALSNLLHDPELEDQEVKQEIRDALEKPARSQQETLANASRKGAEGFIPLNESKAADPYENAMPDLLQRGERGDPEAQHILGERYLVGVGTEPDYVEALKWLTLAAQQNYAPAKSSLAQMYLSGRGVEQDRAEAMRLLKEAEQQGYAPARQLLELLRRSEQ